MRRLKFSAKRREREGGGDEATCESNAKGNKRASEWEWVWKEGCEGEQHQVACWTHLKTVGSWLYELPLLTKGQGNCVGSGHYAS